MKAQGERPEPVCAGNGTTTRRREGLSALGVLVLTIGLSSVANAVVVAPHAVFIDHRTRAAVFYVQNPDDAPAEVTVELVYGYPVSDENGGVHVELIPDPPADAPSAARWVRALPARCVVAPGARQAIRLLAQPPAGLADGEYWSRIIITSRSGQPPVPATADLAVKVGLTLEMRTITSLIYRKGAVTTGVHLDSFAARVAGDSLRADIRLGRSGGGAFLGTLVFALRDDGDRRVGEWKQAVAVYSDLHRRLAFPVGDLAPGRYTVHLRVSTEREDIPEPSVLPAAPVEQALALDVP